VGTRSDASTNETTTELNRSVMLLNRTNGRISNAPKMITIARAEKLRGSKENCLSAGAMKFKISAKVSVTETL
jgi:hypothetical protein